MKMRALSLFRKLTILLWVGLLVSVYSGVVENTTWKAFAQTNIESESHPQTFAYLKIHTTVQVTPTNQVQHDRLLDDGLWYTPATSQRNISRLGFSGENDHPEYLLASEIQLPKIPELCHGFAIALPRHPWTLFNRGRGRLNGWKESNLQYRFIHHI
ncbi:hypothetical protein SBX64_08530 [Vibrio rhizosphaerae]|uniref:Uncharacterized protein n=1 Tax=Vibrio rhizosphaerae TaxID=398736 RepID=A0ABU4IT69_9VIBR|nr:hypothetical protein [Vibrio rhizosphaerae]MDW6092589.1 hypothetical protein [Vibrio rhizosphaerae]